MKQVLNNVAMLKKADAIVQVVVFLILAIFCIAWTEYFVCYMLAMATLQVITCIAWSLFFTGDTPRFAAGTTIRRLFFIILLAGLMLLALTPGALFFFMMVMLVVGPACGLAYFIITLQEMNFYSKARKPYYLL